ncbi:nickel-dependent lactate racemase [Candidatus Aerophobetes bacterium]|nr:nickel-dependent lactate racemase [Candidatus Aerophobetes bacterium]
MFTTHTKEFTLPYGKTLVRFKLLEKNVMGTLLPKKVSPSKNEHTLIINALNSPIESPLLSDIVSPKSKVALITSDVTRVVPSHKLIPPIIQQLRLAGVKRENISIIFALGVHRKHTPDEQKRLLSKNIYGQYRVIDHSIEDCLDMGKTKNGIPVQIFRPVAEADIRVCIGNIEPHYFAGYTGGAKSIMPGVSSRESVSFTHKLMLLPGSIAGKLEGNPTREAIEEVGEAVGINFILNVILNSKKQIVGVVAGDRIAAHRKGCSYADECFKVPIKQQADVVIVSPGGYPKDISVYQAQKALENAKYAVRERGTIILVAECIEGFGDKIFEQWMLEATSFMEPVERLKKEFILGGHKAAAIGMLLEKIKVIMVSSLSDKKVKELFFTPAKSVDEAISMSLQEYGQDASFLIIPFGGITLPSLD